MKILDKFLIKHNKPYIMIILVIFHIIAFATIAMCGDDWEEMREVTREEKAESVTPTVSIEFKEVRPDELYGLFGVIEDEIYYRYARVPAVDESEMYDFWVTVYGPPQFPQTNPAARWEDSEGRITVGDYLDWANEMGLDGIVAVSPGYPDWYNGVRDEMPPVIRISGHDEADGIYLCVDRMSTRFTNHLDIWVADPYPDGTYFSAPIKAMEVELDD